MMFSKENYYISSWEILKQSDFYFVFSGHIKVIPVYQIELLKHPKS